MDRDQTRQKETQDLDPTSINIEMQTRKKEREREANKIVKGVCMLFFQTLRNFPNISKSTAQT